MLSKGSHDQPGGRMSGEIDKIGASQDDVRELRYAVEAELQVVFWFAPVTPKPSREYTVRPLKLVQRNNRTYLSAFDPELGGVRQFGCHRMVAGSVRVVEGSPGNPNPGAHPSA